MVSTSLVPAGAAFEWDHPSPESWIAGDSPYRWPAAEVGRGWRMDLQAARPWSWPELQANAVRAAFGHPRTALGVSVAQLSAGSYGELRVAAGCEQEHAGQRLALVASFLDLTGGSEARARTMGGELDLGWTTRLGWVLVSASATGILQSGGAAAAGAPRTFCLRVRSPGPGALLEGRFEDGSRGRRTIIGLAAPLGPLRLGAALSTGEPTVRCMAGVRRGALALTAGIAWHAELPPSEAIALAIGARAAEP
jgi:hypothetical protein